MERSIKNVALVGLLSLFVLAGCGGGSTTQGKLPNGVSEVTIVNGDDAITVPMKVDDLLALGWDLSESRQAEILDKSLEPHQYTSLNITKNGQTIRVYMANFGDGEASTVRESTAFAMLLKDTDAEEWALSTGIKPGVSSREDVVEAYGEPTRSEDDRMTYDHFLFNLKNDIVSSIGINGTALNGLLDANFD